MKNSSFHDGKNSGIYVYDGYTQSANNITVDYCVFWMANLSSPYGINFFCNGASSFSNVVRRWICFSWGSIVRSSGWSHNLSLERSLNQRYSLVRVITIRGDPNRKSEFRREAA